jgi:hypothetical protein
MGATNARSGASSAMKESQPVQIASLGKKTANIRGHFDHNVLIRL